MKHEESNVVTGTIEQYAMNSPSKFDEAVGQVKGNIPLLDDPVKYAEGAIACIEVQLTTAKSKSRKAKLEHKLNVWRKTLGIFTEINNV